MVGDLPRNVIKQWRKWCLQLSFTDDEMMSKANTASLLGFYANTLRTMRRWSPDEVGLARIGRFGFFRAAARQWLWEARLRSELAAR